MKKRVQPVNNIQRPGDVEAYDVSHEFNQFIDPVLQGTSRYLTDLGVPHVFITTVKVDQYTDEQGKPRLESRHAVRINNVNVVRDFALALAHEAVMSKSHTEMGARIAELGLKSTDFIEAFFAHLEKAGVFAQVVRGSVKPPTTH